MWRCRRGWRTKMWRASASTRTRETKDDLNNMRHKINVKLSVKLLKDENNEATERTRSDRDDGGLQR
uniref:Uncharacterized protein n=1 Tax=Chromera velia CCMP2878 TaxID=1169474 RepID=A0A0G4HI91_9ALVE|eukprot:Cvel_6967.t1-p1 / transcript=Cvel_6967.t1 / gene=Cvel_6967 / organism=Chromera_velia_CCMP2878 / gene_product=hypothetical protein / transcript_product=hypothetical protein / location=Cvel_scaffold353:80060-80257(-) / protein_length=66 / sequence_SO=supercontig / SO=protein_coding / is_pseudo=false